jgi:hypothetical protein
MKNLRRVALVAGIALSAVAFSPKAQAQTADVDFTGNVPATCTVNSVTPGTLALVSQSGGTNNVLRTNVGSEGKINVSCNAGTTFTINSITNNGTDSAIFSNIVSNQTTQQGLFVSIANPSGNAIANSVSTNTSPVQPGPIVNQDYDVYLTLINPGNASLPVGNYGFRVNVSLAPQ